MELFTLGHSTRTLAEFLQILKVYRIEVVADVRAFPGSQRFPYFARESLAKSLGAEGIEYIWLGKELGGYRKSGLGAASPNTAWSSQGFRNYADHMLTKEFQRGVAQLLALAETKRVAILCAEKFWWRCHRRLISDWLVAHGHKVNHILEQNRVVEHRLSPFAKIEAGQVIYPGGEPWSPGCTKPYYRKKCQVVKPDA